MAQPSNYCQDHGTGTTTCSNHRASCATNRTLSLSSDYGVPGRVVRASDIENVRVNIRAELARWNLHAGYNFSILQPGSITSGLAIDDTHVENLISMINSAYGGGTFGDLQGDLIEDGQWDTIRDRYNVLRQNCICNSDCACNNVCACHNDCGCNYSDERLKENITFIKKVNDLNIYTWTYIWDKATEFTGVIAQELVNTKYDKALTKDNNGFYMVNYNKLPTF